jgi:hypothetical protein
VSIVNWIVELTETGRVRVPRPGELSPSEREGLAKAIADWDAVARLDLAGAPALDAAAAAWAAVTLYRACQYLVYRDADAEEVRAGLAEPCPSPASAAVFYSVDLMFRYLRDLVALSRGIAEQDPLVEALLRLAREWPLSSVGVRGVGEGKVEVSGFIEHPCLRRLYADRILAAADVSRLGDPRVKDAVREAIGGHPELAPPAIAAALAAEEKVTHA